MSDQPFSDAELVGLAIALGARQVTGWSIEEDQLSRQAADVDRRMITNIRREILDGGDPLGVAFLALRSRAAHRQLGATFTPRAIVHSMADWALSAGKPARVVDPGCGSGRYLIAVGRALPGAQLIGIEVDPLSALVARANLAAAGFAERAVVLHDDYRAIALAPITGQTLFIGNPPYVRHHAIESKWKHWFVQQSQTLGHRASQLAGLHIHFFLATLLNASPGDYGTLITAAEWLDVNYGRVLREWFLSQLGGLRITLIDPRAVPFVDAASTAAITDFRIGSHSTHIAVRCIRSLNQLSTVRTYDSVARSRLVQEQRWSNLTRYRKRQPSSFVPLGELCRVHRGQVTGSNKVWIQNAGTLPLPASVLYPAITKARELFEAGDRLECTSALRNVVDLPVDLDVFASDERLDIHRFLAHAKRAGADQSFVARHRRAWWSVGLGKAAPILATYMARRPPAFVRNLVQARHINIAHGLYPLEDFSERVLTNLISYLRSAVQLSDGRMYAGGLTKFEPREMERLLVPRVETLDSKRVVLAAAGLRHR